MAQITYRPEGIQGQGDSRLPRIVQPLWRMLARLQRDLAYDSLRLGDDGLGEIAGLLVDTGSVIERGCAPRWNRLPSLVDSKKRMESLESRF